MSPSRFAGSLRPPSARNDSFALSDATRDHRGIASADSYDGTPHGYHVLSVDGTRYTTRYVAASEPGKQMRISLETQFHADDRMVEAGVPMVELLRSPITIAQAAGTRVTANVFDGGPKTHVSFAIDGGPPLAMTRVARPDPFVVQVYGRHPTTIKTWVRPQVCSHLWSAPLPAGLALGSFALTVSVVDEYGRPHEEHMVLGIV